MWVQMRLQAPTETVSEIDEPSIESDDYRVNEVLRSICWLGFLAHTGFIPLFFWMGIPTLGYFNIFSAIAWFIGILLTARGGQGAAIGLITVEVIAHSSLATWCFGWDAGFQTYLMPMLAFTMMNTRIARWPMLLQSIGIVGLYIGLYLLMRNVPTPLPDIVVEIAFYLNVVIVFSALGIITYFFRKASVKAETAMELAASTDMLTMLHNRRRMRELLDLEWKRCDRSGVTFGVLMGDIDRFKRLNDRHGHACGDEVLRNVAARLSANLREQDMASRWGGEEFLILLPHTDIEQARLTAERIRKSFESEPFYYDGKELRVTLTFGVAVCSRAEPVESCVNRADEALYEGKRRGRNRVMVSETPAISEARPSGDDEESRRS